MSYTITTYHYRALALAALIAVSANPVVAQIAPAQTATVVSAPVNPPAPAPNPNTTLADQQLASERATALVPLVFPKLADSRALLEQSMKTTLQPLLAKAAVNNHELECLMQAGLVPYMIGAYEQNLDPAKLQTALATLWAQRYPAATLDKIYTYETSAPMQKLRQAQQTSPQAKPFDLVHDLHQQHALSDDDVRYLYTTPLDPDIAPFTKAVRADFHQLWQQSVKQVLDNKDALIRQFMSEKAVAITNCPPASPPGRQI